MILVTAAVSIVCRVSKMITYIEADEENEEEVESPIFFITMFYLINLVALVITVVC